MEYPVLIENTTKHYLLNSLKKCHENRVSVYFYVLNFSILAIFICITGFILYSRNKHKLTDYEKKQKMLKDQQYVLSKIRFHKENVRHQNESMSPITHLPVTEMHM